MTRKLLVVLFAASLVGALVSCSDDSGTTPKSDTGSNKEAGTSDDGGTTDDSGGSADAADTSPIDVDKDIAGTMIDRAGRPGINTVLLHAATQAQKDKFNETTPDALASDTDLTKVQKDLIDAVSALGSSCPIPVATVKAVLVDGGDVLSIDVSGSTTEYLSVELAKSGAFGGRGLEEDVVNASLAVLTCGAITTDKVDANDKTFGTTFPYLAAAH